MSAHCSRYQSLSSDHLTSWLWVLCFAAGQKTFSHLDCHQPLTGAGAGTLLATQMTQCTSERAFNTGQLRRIMRPWPLLQLAIAADVS